MGCDVRGEEALGNRVEGVGPAHAHWAQRPKFFCLSLMGTSAPGLTDDAFPEVPNALEG